MDPLTITASVLSITTTCIHIAKDLSDLREKFKDAQMMISAICSESTVISASLAHIQTIVLSNPDALTTQLQFRPELEGAFDTALTGCMMVFSVLQDEVQSLTSSSKSASKDIGWSIKAKYLWKEENMKDLLQQLRGQQTALTLLIQALQMCVAVTMYALTCPWLTAIPASGRNSRISANCYRTTTLCWSKLCAGH